MTLAKRAIGVTPIIGETSTRRVGRGQRRVLERVERVARHQCAAVRIADERRAACPRRCVPRTCRTPRRTAAFQSSAPLVTRPAGTVPCPGIRSDERSSSLRAQHSGDRPHRVRRIRESVNQQRAAAHGGRFDLERAVVVALQSRRARSAAADVSVHLERAGRSDNILDAGAHLVEHSVLSRQIVGEREAIVISLARNSLGGE